MSFVRVLEPRMAVVPESESLHVISGGSQRMTTQVLTADSSQVLAPLVSAVWSINPPSNQTVIDRFIKVRAYMEVKCTGGNFEIASNDCMRQFPLNSLVDVTSVRINGESISDNSGDILHAQLCYHNEAEDRRKSWSTTAAQPDMYQNLQDYLVLGTARNVAANYGENSLEPTRGGFEVEVVDPQTLRFVVTEPLFISPMYNGAGRQVEGFVNVNELNINLRFKSMTERFMTLAPRLAPGVNITSCTAQFYRAPEVLINYLTPDNLQALPDTQTLGYTKPQSYLRQLSPDFAIGETRTVTSDSIRLSQIPSKIMLFARRQEAASTFDKPDSFLKIKGVSVDFNNESGLLAGATQQDLFEISRRNGCNLSYPQFTQYRGGVLVLDMGKDIGLVDSLAPGVQGSFTIRVSVTFENVSGEAYPASYYMVLYNVGAFSISQNSARSSLGNLSQSMVLSSSGGMHMPHHEHSMLKGGSLLGSLSTIIPRGHVRGASGKMEDDEKEPSSMPARRVIGGSLRRR